ncbi:murein L,D-transpeptidase [Alicyclobacillaceae bacterium I2511]|nr:murein L,D-transpeptidase [Alicyclobacillaceae bacterium I2511]
MLGNQVPHNELVPLKMKFIVSHALYHNHSWSLRTVRIMKGFRSFNWIWQKRWTTAKVPSGSHVGRLLCWLCGLSVLSLTVGCATSSPDATRKNGPIGSPTTKATLIGAVGALSAKAPVTEATDRPPVQKPFKFPTLQVGSSGTTVLRLQELLAEQGYLPLTWHAQIPSTNTLAGQIHTLTQVQKGAWQWTSNWPLALKNLWQPGVYTLMTKGAVMTFESAHGLHTDGIAGPQVWSALVQNHLHAQHSPWPYAYVFVSEGSPEQLTLWSGGHVALHSLTNTGIPQAPTAPGTWPVYLRYTSQTMSGTLPDGQPYSDPGVPWVNYFHGGDAVHGFPRAAYGFPQSLGCVELPISEAALAWPYIHYGTLVTVAV